MSEAKLTFRTGKKAFGSPGITPRWTRSSKEGVGTAYSTSSHVWYTISHGIVNEVYYPIIDRPQIRDFQFMVTDGKTFAHGEKHDMESRVEMLSDHSLGFLIVNKDVEGRYELIKEVIANPHQDALLIHTKLRADEAWLGRLKLYALLAPHLQVGGWGNNGYVTQVGDRLLLVAEKKGVWVAMCATAPFVKASAGYVGSSDGWTDVKEHHGMEWEFDIADQGNVALTGEVDLSLSSSFTMALAFGDTFHSVTTTLFQSLDVPFSEQRQRFINQWDRTEKGILPLSRATLDGGKLYHVSHSLLSAHEDKRYQGALIASLSVPWGSVKGDEDIGGYHLVWTRDLVQSALALLASGNKETPIRSLIYLSCSQLDNGGFYQNFWVPGKPYWRGVQLDEVAFPILLAWKLSEENALRGFDPYPLVRNAACFLVVEGPATPQERWEENSGYSPSTLAIHIAALICAAKFARSHGDGFLATFFEEYADFLESHIESWTVTTEGSLLPAIRRHYIRIQPIDLTNPKADENANRGEVTINNQPRGMPFHFAAKEIVDAGFLQLVRYGIRKPRDPLIEDTLKVIDAVLAFDTPFGPCWHRYNHDGYGEGANGEPYQGTGIGRGWPLLTGERGHYELAAGRSIQLFLSAMEGFARATGLLPEQVWDGADIPQRHLRLGYPTGSAMPLMWAHAEYMKLVRSATDGQVYEFIPEVAERYQRPRDRKKFEVWKFNRQPSQIQSGSTLRIITTTPFVLHWTNNQWIDAHDTPSSNLLDRIAYVDIDVSVSQQAPLDFTFYWPDNNRWEGNDFRVNVVRSPA